MTVVASGGAAQRAGPIDRLLTRFEARSAALALADDPNGHFCDLYLRSTEAVRDALRVGRFADPAWVEQWDVAFADLYLDALDDWTAGARVVEPWRLAFESAGQDPTAVLLHHLVGLNAHLNYDLPLALLAVMSPADFDDDAVLSLRHRDFRTIDDIMVRRIPDEYEQIQAVSGARTRLRDRALYPLNLLASRRWLPAARGRVWANARQLDLARRRGPDALARRVAQLECVVSANLVRLTAPGLVLLRLGIHGFGVTLPETNSEWAMGGVDVASARPGPQSRNER